jgi:DNA polymerase-3 subunit epsilon
MAKDLHPGKRNGLDALCDRYEIDNSARTLHGALLDAELLAEVYLAMTRGQGSLIAESGPEPATIAVQSLNRAELNLKVMQANAAELALHESQLAELNKASGGAIWLK